MGRHLKKIIIVFPLVVGGIFLFVWFFQWLWNTLLPEILGVKNISYWQAFGILLLCKIMFGGFKGPGRKKMKHRKDFPGFRPNDKERMREEWRDHFARYCNKD